MTPVSPAATTNFSGESARNSPPVSGSSVPEAEGLSTGTPIQHRKSLWHQPLKQLSAPVKCNPAAGLNYLRNYPSIQLPRLLIDGVLLRKEKGLHKYEAREPGCLDTLVDGWLYIIDRLKELSVDKKPVIDLPFILKLHRQVAAHYQECNPGKIMTSPRIAYYNVPLCHSEYTDLWYFNGDGLAEAETIHRKHLLWCGEPHHNATAFALKFSIKGFSINLPAGVAERLYKRRFDSHAVKEMLKKLCEDKTQPDYYRTQKVFEDAIKYFETDKGSRIAKAITTEEKLDILLTKISNTISHEFGCLVFRKTPPVRTNLKLVHLILYSLNIQLMNCKNREHLIDIICYHISELEQVHPFKSVNGRTFTLLMQYLLMAYGFPPGTFYMPENLLFCSHKWQVLEVKNAIKRTIELILHGKSRDFFTNGYQAQTSDDLYRTISARMAYLIKR